LSNKLEIGHQIVVCVIMALFIKYTARQHSVIKTSEQNKYRQNEQPNKLYGFLIQDNSGGPVLSLRRDLLKHHWIFMPCTHSTYSVKALRENPVV